MEVINCLIMHPTPDSEDMMEIKIGITKENKIVILCASTLEKEEKNNVKTRTY